MPRRRAVLAAAPTLLSAGCLQFVCPYGTRVTAGPFRPETDAVIDPTGKRRELARRAVDEGTASATLAGAPPIRDGAVVVRDGTYYVLEVADRRSETVPALIVDLTWESGHSPPDGATVLAADELPAADGSALEYAVLGHAYDESGHPSGSLRLRDVALPYPDGLGDSRLADADRVWITREGRAYRVTVRGEGSRRRYTYDYAATEVATDLEGFRDWVAEERMVELDDLDAGSRAILEQAVEDVYRDCREPSDRLKAFQERVAGATGQDATGEWYVGFRGERYTLEISAFATA